MTKREKTKFIRDLIAAVQKDIVKKVGEMPEEWDGHELRRYVADKFEESSMTIKRKGDPEMRRRRRRYENEVLVRNL